MEFGKEGLANASLRHARLKSLHGGVVQTCYPSLQQPHCVRSAQRRDSRRRKPRIVEWAPNGLNMEIRHKPNNICPDWCDQPLYGWPSSCVDGACDFTSICMRFPPMLSVMWDAAVCIESRAGWAYRAVVKG